jgi:ATP-binding cassette subfamily B protein
MAALDLAARRAPLAALGDSAWLLWLVVRAAPRWCALWTATTLVQALLVPAQLWLTKTLVDVLAAQLQGGGGTLAPVWLGLLVGTLLADRLLAGVEPWIVESMRERVVTTLQARVLRHAAGLDLASFEQQHYYDQLDRVLSGTETRWAPMVGQFLGLVREVVRFASYAVALASVAPILLLVAIAGIAPGMAVFFAGGVSYYGLLQRQTRESRLGDYYGSLLTERGFAKEVRLYGLANYALDRWHRLYWQTRDERRQLALRQAIKARAVILASTVANMAALVWVVTTGHIAATVGGYALLFQSLNGVIQTLYFLANALQTLGTQAGHADAVRAFFRLPSEADPSDVASSAAAHGGSDRAAPGRSAGVARVAGTASQAFPNPLRQAIRFEEVWFTYPDSDAPALASVTCEIRAGETVALVGENGAGKTTLVKLLLGLYRPDAGRITFDGVDIQAIDPRSLRQAASAVFQQFVRYQLTFGENVALGQPERLNGWAPRGADSTHGGRGADHEGDADSTRGPAAVPAAVPDPALVVAVARGGAKDVVRALPAGYDTLLGPDVGGVDLSGGEWQRVALARAFLREAQVLVLDEPTAALDPLAELAVFERFADLAHGRTAVLISHRLGMSRLADKVIVLQQGRIVEEGTHDALLRARGQYAALFAAQARWYA